MSLFERCSFVEKCFSENLVVMGMLLHKIIQMLSRKALSVSKRHSNG